PRRGEGPGLVLRAGGHSAGALTSRATGHRHRSSRLSAGPAVGTIPLLVRVTGLSPPASTLARNSRRRLTRITGGGNAAGRPLADPREAGPVSGALVPVIGALARAVIGALARGGRGEPPWLGAVRAHERHLGDALPVHQGGGRRGLGTRAGVHPARGRRGAAAAACDPRPTDCGAVAALAVAGGLRHRRDDHSVGAAVRRRAASVEFDDRPARRLGADYRAGAGPADRRPRAPHRGPLGGPADRAGRGGGAGRAGRGRRRRPVG